MLGKRRHAKGANGCPTAGARSIGVEGVAGGFEVVSGGQLIELANYRKFERD
jgi:hypothetical protein